MSIRIHFDYYICYNGLNYFHIYDIVECHDLSEIYFELSINCLINLKNFYTLFNLLKLIIFIIKNKILVLLITVMLKK